MASLTKIFGGFPLWLWLVIFCGIVLRIASISWNDRLIGDVNLFALTAKEYSESGELYYPMKYDFSRLTKWGELKTPQSQHPPLWSFLAGLFAQVFGTTNTYFTLQVMSLFSQILLLLVMFRLCQFFGDDCTLHVLPWISLSPLLIDFAGNGSQYTFGSVLVLTACLILTKNVRNSSIGFFVAGSLSGLAYCTHGAFILAIISVLLAPFFKSSDLKKCLMMALISSLGFLLSLIPLFIFRLEMFGSIFYNLNFKYFGEVFGKLKIISSNDGVYWFLDDDRSATDILIYLKNCIKVWSDFLISSLWEWGPVALIFSLFIKTFANRKIIVPLLFAAMYLIPILLWPGFKSRFLVPLIPFLLLLTYFGYQSFKQMFPNLVTVRKIAVISIPAWFFISWFVSIWITESPSKYYLIDLKHKNDYAEMLEISDLMKDLEKLPVIGSAKSLDGGIESVYHHGFPYIHARGFDWDAIEKIQHDYHAQYFWTDEIMLPKYEENLKEMELLLQSGKFRLYRFAESNG